ncbi:MAG: hypothetical protein Q4B88_00255 [Moraxella sp.]|nr:hypothetical protein [Moraxella sp.]
MFKFDWASLRRYVLFGGFALGLLLSQAVSANDATLGDEEYRASICAIASQGAFASAVARQKGLAKEEAAKLLSERFEVLSTSFSHTAFLEKIAEAWQADLNHVYTMDILENDEDKAVFAAMLEELSFSACMGKTPNIAL